MKNSTHKSVAASGDRLVSLRKAVVLVGLAMCALVSISQAGTTNVVLRLDAAQYESAVTALAIWGDSSVYGHDAAQATVGYRPNVVLDVKNGLPVVRLDADDFMTVAHTFTTGSGFIVAKYAGITFGNHDGLYGSTGTGDSDIYWSGWSGSTGWYAPAGSGFDGGGQYLNGTAGNTALTDPAAFNLYSGIDTTPNSLASWNIGRDRSDNNRTWEGDIAEVIVYDDALSDFDRKGVEVYLDEKWGLGKGLRSSYGAGTFNDDPASLGLTPTSTMVLRLDASKFTTAGVITAWSDSSGNSHNATAASDPAVVLNVQNNLPVVRFDGSDDYMTVVHTYTTGSAFIIAKYNSATFNFYDGLYGSATDNGATGMYFTGVDGASTWDQPTGSNFKGAQYLNGVLTTTALTSPSKFNLYSGIDSTPNSFTSWSLGMDRGIGGRTWEGDIAEAIVYEEALSARDRRGVEVYLDEKWGLGLGLRASYGAGNFNDDTLDLGLREPAGTVIVVQ